MWGFGGLDKAYKERTQKAKKEVELTAVQSIVRELNQHPIGTRITFNVDVGPGITTIPVTAYFDAEQFSQSDGVSTTMKMEGIPEEMIRFFQE